MEVGIVKKSPSSDLVCAVEDETALAAFTKMSRADLLALPILDSHGKIVGNLSASDLRGKTGANLEMFNLPVRDFIKVGH
ncbi:MAG: hypothetical protein BJ554DRAFT_3988 [Olpidium bornovanus]|uniref:CBS domain-containing protein n=1 Tax=Olpidium bornovanus TaxID=278681 RepID=A0A8H8DFE9_9FUNG|nr:MAG: hypothetical protein BJ554DRAFT_3988 [Olpidium bornovanus]